jgi:hypothetical protein
MREARPGFDAAPVGSTATLIRLVATLIRLIALRFRALATPASVDATLIRFYDRLFFPAARLSSFDELLCLLDERYWLLEQPLTSSSG